MAKYDVRRSCGHVEECELFGKIEERKRRIARMEESPCRECVRASHADANAESAAANEAAGLPSLSGTQKQISWAESIRRDFFSTFDRVVEKAIAAGQPEDVRQALAKVRGRLMGITSASWWIENREHASRDQAMTAWIGSALRQVAREAMEVAR